jgi:hypothetical protein
VSSWDLRGPWPLPNVSEPRKQVGAHKPRLRSLEHSLSDQVGAPKQVGAHKPRLRPSKRVPSDHHCYQGRQGARKLHAGGAGFRLLEVRSWRLVCCPGNSCEYCGGLARPEKSSTRSSQRDGEHGA